MGSFVGPGRGGEGGVFGLADAEEGERELGVGGDVEEEGASIPISDFRERRGGELTF